MKLTEKALFIIKELSPDKKYLKLYLSGLMLSRSEELDNEFSQKRINLQKDVNNLNTKVISSMRIIEENVKNKIKSVFELYELKETKEMNKEIEQIENDISELTNENNWNYYEEDYQGDINNLKLETSKYVSKDYCNETISKLSYSEKLEKQKEFEDMRMSFSSNGIGDDGLYLWFRMKKEKYSYRYENQYLISLKDKLVTLKEKIENQTQSMYKKFKEFILEEKQEQVIHQQILEDNELDYQLTRQTNSNN